MNTYRRSILISLTLAVFTVAMVTCLVAISDRSAAHAQTVQEVPPYKFADLPHGEIFKAVHEGCELFIVEGSQRVTGAPDSGYFYAITTGRGCR